jgi:Major Facilitator Superfamily.
MVISAGLSAAVFPIFGKICDSFNPKNIMPVAFIIRCGCCFFFYMLEAPNTYGSLCVCASLVLASVAETITCDTIFYKPLAKETRGILCGAYSLMGQFGVLVFSLIAGWLYDTYGPKSPFVFLGYLDFTFVLIVTYSRFKGILE